MAHRFPANVAEKIAREEWEEIVEGRSALWNDIGEDKRECIRGERVAVGGCMNCARDLSPCDID